MADMGRRVEQLEREVSDLRRRLSFLGERPAQPLHAPQQRAWLVGAANLADGAGSGNVYPFDPSLTGDPWRNDGATDVTLTDPQGRTSLAAVSGDGPFRMVIPGPLGRYVVLPESILWATYQGGAGTAITRTYQPLNVAALAAQNFEDYNATTHPRALFSAGGTSGITIRQAGDYLVGYRVRVIGDWTNNACRVFAHFGFNAGSAPFDLAKMDLSHVNRTIITTQFESWGLVGGASGCHIIRSDGANPANVNLWLKFEDLTGTLIPGGSEPTIDYYGAAYLFAARIG